MRILPLLLSIFVCGASFCVTAKSEDLPFHVVVKDDIYEFFYNFDEETITFEVHVKTLGYVGFGLSPHGGMKEADIVIGWVKDGEVFFHDRHSEGNAMPEIDEHQDWDLLSGSENDTHTILRFKRNLKNCDPQDLDISDQTMRVIWSHNPEDPVDIHKVQYHGSENKGSYSIQLLNLFAERPTMPPDAFYIDVLMNNLTLPDYATVVWDQIIEVPDLDRDHHVIMHQPMIQPENADLVHHLVVDSCPDNKHAAEAGFGRLGAAENLPSNQYRVKAPYSDCRKTFVVWLLGSKEFYYPESAGILIGPSNPIKYLKLEIHYNNPTKKVVQDSSGIRLWLTPTLRKYNADILHIAMPVTKNQVIPYHAESFMSSGYCTQECMYDILRGQNINIFAALGHGHDAAAGIKLRHIRNKKELPNWFNDKSYDTHLQEFRLLDKEVVVKPGDSFKVECRYNTMERERVTYGGPSTEDEMCLSMLLYYPAVDVNYCGSYPETSGVLKGMNVTMGPLRHIVDPLKYKGKSVQYVADDQDWDDLGKQEYLEKVMDAENQRSICFNRKLANFKSSNKVFYGHDFIAEPLPEEENCKKQKTPKEPQTNEKKEKVGLVSAMQEARGVNIVNGEESLLQEPINILNMKNTIKEEKPVNIDTLVDGIKNNDGKEFKKQEEAAYKVQEELDAPKEKDIIIAENPQKLRDSVRMVDSGAPLWKLSISLFSLVIAISVLY